VEQRSDCVGFDSSIIVSPKVWEATGHVENFTDPLAECRGCHSRLRADHLLEKTLNAEEVAGMSLEEATAAMGKEACKCPVCGERDFAPVRDFNLLFSTQVGPAGDSSSKAYLRPETAQGILMNYHTVQNTMRLKLPFGIGQTGKSFRNEISPGQFIFRTREFEQCELEYFCLPEEAGQWHQHWIDQARLFLLKHGLREDNTRLHVHAGDELAHYADASIDIEYRFAHGWGELWGIANRTDYDLKRHAAASGKAMTLVDPSTNQKLHPYVIEPAVGLDRLVLAFLTDALRYEEPREGESEGRWVLGLHPALSPVNYAVMPLVKKEPLLGISKDILKKLNGCGIATDFDMAGSIGRRYRRQDEAGTNFCVTVDYQSGEDGTVTVRDRDTMEQERLPIDQLLEQAVQLQAHAELM